MTLRLSLNTQQKIVREVAEKSGQNLYACYQCGKCTAGCPFNFTPQQVVRSMQLGHVERAVATHTTWECAGCQTCTAACPKSVDPVRIMRALRTLDLDRLRAEDDGGGDSGTGAACDSLASLYKAHKKPLRSHLFVNHHRLSRWGSRFAPVSNWLQGAPGAALAAHYFLGIDRRRALPGYVRGKDTFPAWFGRHTPAGDGHRGTVYLFHDTFMDYSIPDIGMAATELLEKAGFRVELTDNVCCGRAMISKTFMDRATGQACINIPRLYEQVRDGAFIVGCEPSCLLTLRDEYPLLVDDPELKEKAGVVARHSLLIDEFLYMLSDQGELELSFNGAGNGNGAVVFHGHCQQKALADPAKSLELLRLAGYRTEFVNAVCCGMAGTFGYEREHFAVSRATFDRDVGPAVKAHPDAQVVVMGISCRHQIEDFTGRHPRHLVQVLRDAAA